MAMDNSNRSTHVAPMNDLRGKTALITGGATGIGLALALELAKEGTKVVLASTNEQRLEAAADQVRHVGGEAVIVVCDVSNRASVEDMHRTVTEKYGDIDVLCCNAGVTTGGPYLEHRPSDWEWVYGVVLQGTVNCIQMFYPDICKRGSGQIVLTGSQAGMVPDWSVSTAFLFQTDTRLYSPLLQVHASRTLHFCKICCPCSGHCIAAGSRRAQRRRDCHCGSRDYHRHRQERAFPTRPVRRPIAVSHEEAGGKTDTSQGSRREDSRRDQRKRSFCDDAS